MNQLTSKSQYEADELFATLDATTKSIHLTGNLQVTLTDTVGSVSYTHLDVYKRQFFSQRKQKVTRLLTSFTEFLQEAQLSQNLQALIKDLALEEQERYDQVWKAFLHVLEELNLVFEDQGLTVDDFLALLLSGMQLSQYRTVPATVDVVTVQSYDLIEPLTAPYVYAIGLTQERFPKIAQNTSLLSEEERQRLNEATQEGAELQVVTSENLKKNRFVAVSLLNAATNQLVLSAPSLVNEMEDSVSPYLVELTKEPIAIEWTTKQAQASSDDIGTYRALLARVIELDVYKRQSLYRACPSHESEDLDLGFMRRARAKQRRWR